MIATPLGKALTLTMSDKAQQNRLQANLTAPARALQIDNYTNQWLWITEADVFVPPGYTDRVILLPDAVSLTVICIAPTGYTQLPPVKGQVAKFTPFVQVQQPMVGIYQPPPLALTTGPSICNFSALGHVGQSDSHSVTVPIIPALSGIELSYAWQTVNGIASVVSLPSNTTLFSTANLSTGADGTTHRATITPDQLVPGDSQLQFSVTASGASAFASLAAYAVLGTTFVSTDFNRPLNITGINPAQLLTGAAASGQKVLSVGNADLFTPGAAVNIHRKSDGKSESAIIDQASGSTITLDTNLVNAYVAGDAVIQQVIVGIYGQPIDAGAFLSLSKGLVDGPTQSGSVNQATANANTDLTLITLGADPVLYHLDLVGANTSASNVWSTIRLHNATSAKDLNLAVIFAKAAGSAAGTDMPSRTWIFDPPLEPARVGGATTDSWAVVVNAGVTGVFWGGGASWA